MAVPAVILILISIFVSVFGDYTITRLILAAVFGVYLLISIIKFVNKKT